MNICFLLVSLLYTNTVFCHKVTPAYFDILQSQNSESQWLDLRSDLNLKNVLVSRLSSFLDRKTVNNGTSTFTSPPTPFNPLVDQCLTDLGYMIQNLNRTWARKVLDSAGKPHSGLYTGNVMWLGDKRECECIHASGNISQELADWGMGEAHFQGTYGIVMLQSKGTTNVAVPGATLFGRLLWGFCTSKSCSQANITELEDIISEIIIDVIKWNISIPATVSVFYPTKLHSLDTPAVVAICLLIVLSGLLVIGTIVDLYISRKESNDKPALVDAVENGNGHSVTENDTTPIVDAVILDNGQPRQKDSKSNVWIDIMICFSIIRNGKKVLHVEEGGTDIRSLHGIRFLSMAWVILGHTFYFGFSYTSNPLDVLNLYNHGFSFQAILNATYSVDTFFLLSGFLLAYHFFRITEKQPERLDSFKFWCTFYFHRIWRLTPTYAMVLCTYIGLWKYVGNGPLWPTQGFEVDHCKRTWWTNLLYINNLVYTYSDSTDGKPHQEWCAGWTWYLANDMQFFALSPLILYPLRKSWNTLMILGSSSIPSKLSPGMWGIIGWVVLFTSIIISMVTTGLISASHNLPPNMFPPNLNHVPEKFTLLYIKPWGRVVPFLVGIAAAKVFVNISWMESLKRNSKINNFIGWFVSSWLCGLVLFGLWPQYRGTVYTANVAAFYAAGSRLSWALGVSWVILTCASGNSGPVNRFLSWKLWIPLSRLTYCAYLIHPMIMYAFYYSLPVPFTYTDANMTWYFAGFLVYAYTGAFIVSICMESPFMALDKLFFSRSTR